MIKRPGRLFWKCFVLIALVQISSDEMVHRWITSHYPQDSRSYAPAPQEHQHAEPNLGLPMPLLVDIVASLASAALLAWLFSKPIRNLRSALADAAGGNLDIRVAETMGRGNDELKDLGIEFDRMIARLQAVITAQRRLLNDVSHETRSPMARIQAAVGLAYQQPDQAQPMLERIERESIRVDRLMGELLALSRLQAGVDYSSCEEIDLHELLSSIIDDARFEASAKGRSIRVGATLEGAVRGNAELLRRAVENVVRNAVKFSHRDGTVTVETMPAAGGRRVGIAVQDTGTGVPEADLANIFDPFFRSSTHVRKEGSGLGLEIAKRVIESHGGTITASNVPGGGLRVVMELPLLS